MWYFETWYKSVLLTRKNRGENAQDEQLKLEKIGSNCANLMAALPRCDLKNRDFSECSISYAYFYKRDLSGSKEKIYIYKYHSTVVTLA